MSTMMELLRKVSGLFVGPVSDGTDTQNKILREELDFNVHEYPSGAEHNGWIVPDKWQVIKAEIRKDGKLIYDGAKHPLGVIGSSESFVGTVSLDELKKHVYYFEDAPDEIVYHCDLYYKPHRKLWGFSLPYRLFQTLRDGQYDIELITSHTKGTMKVLEYTHHGSSGSTIVFNAHNCHAAQLNDGPVGYAVFIEVMKRLKAQRTKYTYQLVVAPEHLGTVFYLAGLPETKIQQFKLGMFLEMVGHDNPIFSLQESFYGNSVMDTVADHILKFKSKGYWRAGFRKIIGNDESVWEAPGYEVPMISLSRCESTSFTYPQYHLSSDTIDILHEDKLTETVELIMQMIDVFEKNCRLKRKFTGLVALSNPKYDLYIVPGTDPSIKAEDNDKTRLQWFDLMNCLPRYFNSELSVFDIAVKHNLSFDTVYEYVSKFRDKNLVEFVDYDFI